MVWIVLAFWILIHLHFYYYFFHFIAHLEIVMYSCCLHSGGTSFKFMSLAVWKRLGVSVIGDSSPVSHSDFHSGHSWTSLDGPSPWEKIWKGMVLGLNKRGDVCLVSRMFFYMDTHSVGDSPYSMVWRWHLLSPSPWLNLTSEGRHLELEGVPIFSWNKSDCEGGKKRPTCAG